MRKSRRKPPHYSYSFGRVVSARNEHQKKVQKIERKEFPSYLSQSLSAAI